MSRAAINIIGATGEMHDLTSLGSTDVDSYRKSIGVYCVTGSQGMVPFPPADQGWGYSLHPSESAAKVEIVFNDDLLTVAVTMDGEPYDLKTMITLHILVPDLPPLEMPPLPPQVVDQLKIAQAEIVRLRNFADYAIAPLQDAVDIGDASETEITELNAWKKYRVALSRVPDQVDYPRSIEWPAMPA
ncbi:tail fiber assembly protein [Pseudomonas sp. T8]|uniref:tail fiber assembly protein n=1 Tax=Pseudomonas sp. T8 TaxID=645292 RepID=UPI0027D339E5|nr:tail fiber assembly protein [Pseudomonas sp. T8]